jgi:RNA polymerase sigma-70 factor (ECF subfamily)
MEPMTNRDGWQDRENDSEDGVLVRRTLGGDQSAYEILVRRHERLVFKIAGGFLRDRRDVEEVAQEAFLRAYEALPGFRLGAPFAPWIARIVTRASYDRLRQRRRAGEVFWEDLSPAEQAAARDMGGGVDSLDRSAARDLLERAMASLPPKDRMVLILADALGFSGAEVAKAMGCSSVAGRIRLHRARREIRGIVENLLAGMKDAG